MSYDQMYSLTMPSSHPFLLESSLILAIAAYSVRENGAYEIYIRISTRRPSSGYPHQGKE